MSLVVTSCTMGQQPERLLIKGPQYLRTRSNSGIFAQSKKTAAELLAESKAQFYSSRDSTGLPGHQDLAVTTGQTDRYFSNVKKPQPPRSKSQFDLSQFDLSQELHSRPVNNCVDEIADNDIDVAESNCSGGSDALTRQGTTVGDQPDTPTAAGATTDVFLQPSLHPAETLISATVSQCNVTSTGTLTTKPQPKLSIFHSWICVQDSNDPGPEAQSAVTDDVHCTTQKKPVPLPRKSKQKPVPLPRKLSLRSPLSVTSNSPATRFRTGLSSSLSLHSLSSVNQTLTLQITELKASARTPGAGIRKQTPEADIRKQSSQTDIREETSETYIRDETSETDIKKQTSEVDLAVPRHRRVGGCQSRRHRAASAGWPVEAECNLQSTPEVNSCDIKPETGNPQTVLPASPVPVQPDIHIQKLCAQSVSILESGPQVRFQDTNPPHVKSPVSRDGEVHNRIRSRHAKVSTSSSSTDIRQKCETTEKAETIGFADCGFDTVDTNSGSVPARLEMSIESVDQAVCESEVSAIPSVSMDASSAPAGECETREITRSNSSLSGKCDFQSASPLSLSPTPHCSSVPRSYSDISCQLEGQHSRDSSIVSTHSRLSRASIGTDLETFFNQMGLEKGVLEPIHKLKELQNNEIFDSMSSLDSHDAASICSTYSRSDQEWSDSQSLDRNLQQTSIVERNARIIKWLCNVRKAKVSPQKSDTATASHA